MNWSLKQLHLEKPPKYNWIVLALVQLTLTSFLKSDQMERSGAKQLNPQIEHEASGGPSITWDPLECSCDSSAAGDRWRLLVFLTSSISL